MRVLLSIKPEFVEKIFSGEKLYEYRKATFKNEDISSVVIYSTMPVGKIVGEFKFKKIHIDSPEIIWNETKQHSGISKKFFLIILRIEPKLMLLKLRKLQNMKNLWILILSFPDLQHLNHFVIWINPFKFFIV